MAAVDKEYTEAAKQVEEASAAQGMKIAENLEKGGSWYLEAVDLIQEAGQDSGQQAFDRIRTQLADLNSDKCAL